MEELLGKVVEVTIQNIEERRFLLRRIIEILNQLTTLLIDM